MSLTDQPLDEPTLPCGVEGCKYAETDDDGCGLARLISTELGLALWDAGDSVVRGCYAHHATEWIIQEDMW